MKIKVLTVGLAFLFFSSQCLAIRYSERLCRSGKYDCLKVKRGQSWNTLFPEPYERDLVRAINRTNMRLYRGSIIAVPKNLSTADALEYAPFDQTIDGQSEKTIVIDPKKLAWGAYDHRGSLVGWGPASLGKGWCSDVQQSCKTVSGSFRVFRKQGAECISNTFPLPDGGAIMPYCMFFHRGFAIHGSLFVPGYNASHGCVRVFPEDARWLNTEFIDLPRKGKSGTRVIVRGYD